MSKQIDRTVPATAGAARFALKFAEARIAKAQAVIDADTAFIEQLNAALPGLPEGAAGGNKIVAAAVGDTVQFRYGREDRSTTITGVIQAAKVENAAVKQFRVVVGDPESFDAKFYNIFPGQVLVNETRGE